VAATRAVELGFTTFACASTGNLAGSVASHAARLGLDCSVFIPDDLEVGKIAGASVYRPRILAVRGNYDDVNRLCTQVADQYGWGFANINLRAYYAEGAKTYGFEIAAAFDIDRRKIGQRKAGVLIEDVAALGFLSTRGIHLGIVTVPETASQDVTDALVKTGVKGILNFAPRHIVAPRGVKVITIDIAMDLARLPYYLSGNQR